MFVGVFVTSGAILFLPGELGITAWATPFRGYLVGAFILSGTVLLTYVATAVRRSTTEHRGNAIDLRMVVGSPLHATWSIGMTPMNKRPMLILVCTMTFAHKENGSVIIRRAYLMGTKEEFPTSEIIVAGPYGDRESLSMGVTPIKAKPGKALIGRLVFVDQFNHKHISDKITFRPNTLPSEMHTKRLARSPNCVFCYKPVELKDQAAEAQMTAHTKCIWS